MSEENEKSKQFTWVWAIVMTFLYFVVAIAMLNPSTLNDRINKEVEMYVDVFGPDATNKIIENARSQKKWLLYDSGLNESVRTLVLPKEYILTGEVKEKGIGTAFFEKVDNFISNAFTSLDLAILRFCSLEPWLILSASIIGMCIYTGYMRREIKKQNFDYSSPFWRGLSKKFIMFLPILFLGIFMIPIPITPMYVPFLMSVIGAASLIFVSNTIKRL